MFPLLLLRIGEARDIFLRPWYIPLLPNWVQGFLMQIQFILLLSGHKTMTAHLGFFFSFSLFPFCKRKAVSFHMCNQDLEVCQHLSDSSFSKDTVNAGNQILAVRPKVDTWVPNSIATLTFEPTSMKECKAESKTALSVATLLPIVTEPTWLFILRIWIMYKRILEKYL